MSTSQLSTQSAVARRSAEAQLGGLIAKFAPAHQLEGASTLARPEVARLVDQAIASNRVPFARTGRGPVVIRSASVKPRQRRRPA
jgi:hypothetical protein